MRRNNSKVPTNNSDSRNMNQKNRKAKKEALKKKQNNNELAGEMNNSNESEKEIVAKKEIKNQSKQHDAKKEERGKSKKDYDKNPITNRKNKYTERAKKKKNKPKYPKKNNEEYIPISDSQSEQEDEDNKEEIDKGNNISAKKNNKLLRNKRNNSNNLRTIQNEIINHGTEEIQKKKNNFGDITKSRLNNRRNDQSKSQAKEINLCEDDDDFDDVHFALDKSVDDKIDKNYDKLRKKLYGYERHKCQGFLIHYQDFSCNKRDLKLLLKIINENINAKNGNEKNKEPLKIQKYLLVSDDKDTFAFIWFNKYFNFNKSVPQNNPFIIRNNNEPDVFKCNFPSCIIYLCYKNENKITNMPFDEKIYEQAFKNKMLDDLDIRKWTSMGYVNLKDLENTIRGYMFYVYYKNRTRNYIQRRKIWLYGPSHCGKTTVVQNAFKNLYRKHLNETWENYQYQKTVYVELNEEYSPRIANLLKDWTENYEIDTTVNGIPVRTVYTTIIIICQNSFVKYFEGHEEMIHRFTLRCESIFMSNVNDGIWIQPGLVDKSILDKAKQLARYLNQPKKEKKQ